MTDNFFKKNGYSIIDIFSKKDVQYLIDQVKNNFMQNYNFKIDNIENYHQYSKDENQHQRMMNPELRFIKLTPNITKKINNKKLLNIIFDQWGHKNIENYWLGDTSRGFYKKNHTGFRISRPLKYNNFKNQNDAAGVHLDKNAGGKIRKESDSLLTLWIPLIGFNYKYTLRIAPKSHLVNHKVSFTKKKKITPIISKKYENNFKFIRPNLKIGQGLLIHSNLLHGGSINYGIKSRLSLDLRIINKKSLKKVLN